jgi:hypothetical protein
MRPVELSDIKNIAEYELLRPELRPRMMALKDRRRVRLGDHLTLLFENRETVLYQIQEMMRIERMVKADDIANEAATYNELIPAQGEFSATLLIEYENAEERALRLRDLLGLERHIWLEAGGERCQAHFDVRQMSPQRLSAVQYLKFPLSPKQIRHFARGAKIISDHPNYAARCALSREQLRELEQDLL